MSVVLLDVDGVLADFEAHVAARLADRGHIDIAETLRAERTTWAMQDILNKRELSIFYKMLEEPFTHDMPLIEGAADLVRRLKVMGHEVVCVSSPWISNPTWEHGRRQWLKRELGIGHKAFISASVKHHVVGAVLVDDKPTHVHDWSAVHNKCGVLFGQRYNRNEHVEAAGLVRIGEGRWDYEACADLLEHVRHHSG